MTQIKIANKKKKVEAIELVANLDEDKLHDEPWVLTLEQKKPDRSKEQNDLMWVWNGIAAKEVGVSANYIHGLSKMEVLLPLLKISQNQRVRETADFNQEILNNLATQSHKIKVAHSLIETKNLSVEVMQDYLNMYVMYWNLNHSITFPEPDQK